MAKLKAELSLIEKIERAPKRSKWLVSGYLLTRAKSPESWPPKGFFCSKDELSALIGSIGSKAEFLINAEEDAIYRKIDETKVLEALRVK